ncbi:MAG: Hsp70 family protein [Cyanobacteria bacterium P01_D01_bin.1]
MLASHGNNRLGGDDFDQQLQRHLADKFLQTHETDVPDDTATPARRRAAVVNDAETGRLSSAEGR